VLKNRGPGSRFPTVPGRGRAVGRERCEVKRRDHVVAKPSFRSGWLRSPMTMESFRTWAELFWMGWPVSCAVLLRIGLAHTARTS